MRHPGFQAAIGKALEMPQLSIHWAFCLTGNCSHPVGGMSCTIPLHSANRTRLAFGDWVIIDSLSRITDEEKSANAGGLVTEIQSHLFRALQVNLASRTKESAKLRAVKPTSVVSRVQERSASAFGGLANSHRSLGSWRRSAAVTEELPTALPS